MFLFSFSTTTRLESDHPTSACVFFNEMRKAKFRGNQNSGGGEGGVQDDFEIVTAEKQSRSL